MQQEPPEQADRKLSTKPEGVPNSSSSYSGRREPRRHDAKVPSKKNDAKGPSPQTATEFPLMSDFPPSLGGGAPTDCESSPSPKKRNPKRDASDGAALGTPVSFKKLKSVKNLELKKNILEEVRRCYPNMQRNVYVILKGDAIDDLYESPFRRLEGKGVSKTCIRLDENTDLEKLLNKTCKKILKEAAGKLQEEQMKIITESLQALSVEVSELKESEKEMGSKLDSMNAELTLVHREGRIAFTKTLKQELSDICNGQLFIENSTTIAAGRAGAIVKGLLVGLIPTLQGFCEAGVSLMKLAVGDIIDGVCSAAHKKVNRPVKLLGYYIDLLLTDVSLRDHTDEGEYAFINEFITNSGLHEQCHGNNQNLSRFKMAVQWFNANYQKITHANGNVPIDLDKVNQALEQCRRQLAAADATQLKAHKMTRNLTGTQKDILAKQELKGADFNAVFDFIGKVFEIGNKFDPVSSIGKDRFDAEDNIQPLLNRVSLPRVFPFASHVFGSLPGDGGRIFEGGEPRSLFFQLQKECGKHVSETTAPTISGPPVEALPSLHALGGR